MSKFTVELSRSFQTGFIWILKSTKTHKVIARSEKSYDRPLQCEKAVQELFGCNKDVKIVQRPGFRRRG